MDKHLQNIEEFEIDTGSLYYDLCVNWKKYPRNLIEEVEEKLCVILFASPEIKKECFFPNDSSYIKRSEDEANQFQMLKMENSNPPITSFFIKKHKKGIGSYIIPYESYFLLTYEKNKEDFDFFFALKLMVVDLIKWKEFLDYHLDVNFNNDFNFYADWLEILGIKYHDLLELRKVDVLLKKIISNSIRINEKVINNIKKKPIVHPHSFELVNEISNRYKADATELNKLIEDVLNSLKNPKAGFVSENSSLWQVKRIFTGQPILKPVEWIGTAGELYFFIKLLHSCPLDEEDKESKSKPIIKNLNNSIWETTLKCFSGKNKNGKMFDKEMLRKIKETEIKPERKELLIKAVQHLL